MKYTETKNKVWKIRPKVFLTIFASASLVFLISYSYALFTISVEKENAFTMIAGNLYYDLEWEGNKIEKVTVPGNTVQEIALTIHSLNGFESIYQLYTSLLPNGVTVEYVEDSGSTTEEIGATNSTKEITVVITNTSEQEKTVSL